MTDHAEPFIRGNDRLNRLLADPETARRVADIRVGMDAADAAHRHHLTTIRQAVHLAQVAIAEQLGATPAAASNLERGTLLTVLADQLTAAGASHIRISLTLDGQHIDYPITNAGDG